MDEDKFDAVLGKLSVDDTDDGPGLGCTSPEQRSKTAYQVTTTKANKLCTTINENITFALDDLPGIARFLKPCLRIALFKFIPISMDDSNEKAKVTLK